MSQNTSAIGDGMVLLKPFKEARRRLQWFDRTSEKRRTPMTRLQRTSWDAEERIFQAVKSHSLEYSTLENIRIPDPSTKRGKKEVDVVLVTKSAIVLIEVKNWKGKIETYEDENGETDIYQADRSPKPVLSLIRRKCEVLKRMAASRFSDFAGEVFPLVVLANKGGEPNQKINSMTSVCSLHGKPNRSGKELHKAINSLLEGLEPAENNHIERMVQMLKSFGTWDSIHFEGGGKEVGDFSRIPQEWDRFDVESVDIEVIGGRLMTLIRGPKISVTKNKRDGSHDSTTYEEGHEIGLYKAGDNEPTSIPLENLSRVEFGYSSPVDWSRALSGAKVRSGESRGENPLSRFKKGQVVTGTVLAHFPKDSDRVTGILVELVSNQVNGLASTRRLDTSPEMIKFFYAVGKQIRVRIDRIRGRKKIDLTIVEDQ